MQVTKEYAGDLLEALNVLDWHGRLAVLCKDSGLLNIAFSTSFSLEDQLITHDICSNKLPIKLFTLDTGRLFEETYALQVETQKRYGIQIETYFPDTGAVEEFINTRGINSFYESVENRKHCCHIRKVEPLERALKGVDIWISGLRAEHSDSRANRSLVEWDEQRQMIKCYPIFDIDYQEMLDVIGTNQVPYNPMHNKGYPSIGCAPCTRAIEPGESPRAGRWWWEQDGGQECGLHVVDGQLVRTQRNEEKPPYA